MLRSCPYRAPSPVPPRTRPCQTLYIPLRDPYSHIYSQGPQNRHFSDRLESLFGSPRSHFSDRLESLFGSEGHLGTTAAGRLRRSNPPNDQRPANAAGCVSHGLCRISPAVQENGSTSPDTRFCNSNMGLRNTMKPLSKRLRRSPHSLSQSAYGLLALPVDVRGAAAGTAYSMRIYLSLAVRGLASERLDNFLI